ncbi:MAG: hypothetical protein ACRDP8_09205, partial [Actinopolymorphaceae bacterium]
MRLHRSLLAVLAGALTVTSLSSAASAPKAPIAEAAASEASVQQTPAGAAAAASPVTAVPRSRGVAIGDTASTGRRPHVSTVTLVTGDQVRVTTRPNGVRTAVPVPAPGRTTKAFNIRYHGNAIEVVPADAAPLLASGRVDRRLFDAAGLIAAGYADATGRRIPLSVRQKRGHKAFASAPDGLARKTRAGGDGGSASYVLDRRTAAGFWRWLVGPKPAETGRPHT